ncbi:MAG TPA: hydratase, partial [Spirochaeta sp.]|nr:hydratase [Spirochaeta sp.]
MSIKKSDKGCFVVEGEKFLAEGEQISGKTPNADELKKNTIAYNILKEHNTSGSIEKLNIKFDALASHDITYVGIIQTAKASGLENFPIPYILTNCHNSLAAVGGTINEDDHAFGLSAAVKYGGIYVPPHQAVIHQYMREMWAGGGRMILGSDSHTRYGALGTMAVGEGGPELVKQLLGRTWDINYPDVIAVHLTGAPRKGVGPQDVALAIIGEVFDSGFVKNKVMEFIGPGIANLSVEYRNGIDVMTTETTCLSSIWKTDDRVRDYLKEHGREDAYAELAPGAVTYYDGLLEVDLSKVEPMIALPFHPSNVYTIKNFIENANEILKKIDSETKEQFGDPKLDTGLPSKAENGRVKVSQGVIAGCAGGSFENLSEAADILKGKSVGNDHFGLSVYPASQPIYLEAMKSGVAQNLMSAGVLLRSAFCGPCFGAGDVPANKDFSIRHTTRNFPSREGSKPGEGQIASVALMDARSIAATSANKGELIPATEIDYQVSNIAYHFSGEIYENRVKSKALTPTSDEELVFGPNIKDWPQMIPLTENLLLQ